MVTATHQTLQTTGWKKLSELPGAGDVRMLRDEPPCGPRTMVARVPAGGRIAAHCPLATTQHLVLDGEYECGGRLFPRGTYRLLPAGEEVAPIVTAGGVTILVIEDPLDD